MKPCWNELKKYKCYGSQNLSLRCFLWNHLTFTWFNGPEVCFRFYEYDKISERIFSFALCYCTAEILSSRGCPSSIHKTRFLKNRQANLREFFWEKTCPPYIQTVVFVLNFYFCLLFFYFFFCVSCPLTWDLMGIKISNDISSESDPLPRIYAFS